MIEPGALMKPFPGPCFFAGVRRIAGHRAGRALRILFLAPLLSGCSLVQFGHAMLDHNARSIYVITLHEFARPELETGRSLRYVTDCAGVKQVAIKRIPLVTSRSFMSAVALEPDARHSQPGIRFQLDQHGANLWMQAYKTLGGQRIAVVMDGFYYFAMRVPLRVANPMFLEIRGDWNVQEIPKIVKETKENYKLLNNKEKVSLFPWSRD